MVKIRLRRMGARNRPYYRIVVSDSRRTARAEVARGARLLRPGRQSAACSRSTASGPAHWIGKGALVSPTVQSLLDPDPGRAGA